MLAFAFPESPGCEDELRDILTRLPAPVIDNSVVYSLKISLDGSKSRVWRRVLTEAVSLEVLHHIIQLTMGWYDSHLHGFEVRKARVPLVEDGAAIDERGISIAQLYDAKIKRIHYTYDFGDDWRHTVVIEKSSSQIGVPSPQCVDGQGTCPLEDIGGMERWTQLLEAFRHPERERNEAIDDLVDRLNEGDIPPPFDLEETNARLQVAFNKPARRKGQA